MTKPAFEIALVTEVTNFPELAAGYAALLNDPANADIKLDFPNTVARYSSDLSEAVSRFQTAQARCEAGGRDQFALIADGVLVGNASVDKPDELPPGVPPTFANVSLFVCHPYRGNGLGGLALNRQLKVVHEKYPGVWTTVRESNQASNRLFISRGFEPIGSRPGRVETEIIYTRDNSPPR